MGEELKEVWTTQILPVTKFSNNDYYKRKDKGQIEAFDNLSEYKPTYLPIGAMGYNGSNKTYRQLKTIKVKNSNGSFDYYMVPEFAVEGAYVDKPKPVVEPQSNQTIVQTQQVHNNESPKPNIVAKQSVKKSAAPKSKLISKQPVPQNLLPYIANVTSDGVAFFNIPEGYTNDQFEKAVKAVYGLNKDLVKKPMVYYEQPQQQIQQQKQQQQAVQQSQKQYQAQRQQINQQSQAQKQQATQGQNIKYNTSNNTQTVKVPVEGIDKPDLVTEVFAYPTRKVDVYNIHPEAYQKVLEYLKNNFDKTKANNKPNSYILSLSGFEKVPIGGEVNDSVFHYIGKDGQHEHMSRWYFQNANIINKNESFLPLEISDNIVTNNGKIKMYSYSNSGNVYYKNSNERLTIHPFTQQTYNNIIDFYDDSSDNKISQLKERGFNEQQIKDFINKGKNILVTEWSDVNKSIFRPIEKEQTTQNNSTSNIVQKAKQKAKQAGKKVLSFLGFQNGGQLKYYRNLSQLFIPNIPYLTGQYTNTCEVHKRGGELKLIKKYKNEQTTIKNSN